MGGLGVVCEGGLEKVWGDFEWFVKED